MPRPLSAPRSMARNESVRSTRAMLPVAPVEVNRNGADELAALPSVEAALALAPRAETQLPAGPSLVVEPRTSGRGAEVASATAPALDADSITRDLVSKVLEGSDEDRREIATARFLDDLLYNLAVLQHVDLDKLHVEPRGMYALEARASYQLPPRIDAEPGKAGTARLVIVFMDGSWWLH